MRALISTFLILCSIALGNLSDQAPNEVALAESFLDDLISKDFDAVRSQVSPILQEQCTDEKLSELASIFPSEPLIGLELIENYTSTLSNKVWRGHFTFEYEYDSHWAVATVMMVRPEGEKEQIIGFNTYRTNLSQLEANRFTFEGKTFKHFGMLALTLIVPIFIIVTLVVCFRTPIAKKKWAWIAFIFLGMSALKFNWTSGEFKFLLVTVNLLGSGFIKASVYSPLILTTSLPLGAIFFWIQRPKLIEQTTTPSTEVIESDDD